MFKIKAESLGIEPKSQFLDHSLANYSLNHSGNFLCKNATKVGFEPTTFRLTV